MTDEVRNDVAGSRYVLERDGEEIGVAEYVRLEDGRIDFVHTVVDPALEERGLGSMLVKAALDDVRDNSSDRVKADCPFVKAYIARHPEYEDLLSR